MHSAFAALLLLLQQEPSPHEQKTVDARARAFFPTLNGSILATDDAVVGARLSLGSDLGFNPPLAAGELELSVAFIPWLTIRARYWQALFNGSEDVTEDFFFGGSLYAAGTRVDSSLEMQVGSLLAEYNVLLHESPNARWELGVQAGVEVVFFEADLDNALATPSFTERETFFAPIPQVGFRARAEFWDRVSVELWVHGGGIAGIRDERILALEGGAEIHIRVAWGLFVGVGWRLFVADARLDPSANESVEFDMIVSGPMVTLGYRF